MKYLLFAAVMMLCACGSEPEEIEPEYDADEEGWVIIEHEY